MTRVRGELSDLVDLKGLNRTKLIVGQVRWDQFWNITRASERARERERTSEFKARLKSV